MKIKHTFELIWERHYWFISVYGDPRDGIDCTYTQGKNVEVISRADAKGNIAQSPIDSSFYVSRKIYTEILTGKLGVYRNHKR